MNQQPQVWDTPPKTLSLPPNEVHVWRMTLDADAARIQELRSFLSPDECERADRFAFPLHRGRYTVGRALLRNVLAGYLHTSPNSLVFSYGPHGKPSLPADAGRGLRFNVTHSEGLGLIAVTRHRELGIDVESCGRKLSDDKIPERFFSRNEVQELRALPEAQQRAGFFNCWTRKEAFIKATGNGLSQGLNQFDVSLTPGKPARLLATRPDPAEAARWTLCDLSVGQDFAAALIVEGGDWQLRCFTADD